MIGFYNASVILTYLELSVQYLECHRHSMETLRSQFYV